MTDNYYDNLDNWLIPKIHKIINSYIQDLSYGHCENLASDIVDELELLSKESVRKIFHLWLRKCGYNYTVETVKAIVEKLDEGGLEQMKQN